MMLLLLILLHNFDKLTVAQLVKKFPAFYGTRKFIAIFTTAYHWPLSWAIWIQFTNFHLTSPRSVLILYSHLRFDLTSSLFPSDFPTKILYVFLIHVYYMPRPSHPHWVVHPNNVWWKAQFMKLLIILFSPFSCYFLPLRSKYSPQHPVLKHPQSIFSP